MARKDVAVLAAVLSVATMPAYAGMVVTDPHSYTYFVEQIKKQAELVEKAAKQVETMGGVLTEAKKIQANITGHYNRAVALVNRIENLGKLVKSEPSGGILGEAKKWGNVGRAVSGIAKDGAAEGGRVVKDVADIDTGNVYEDTKKVLDQVFTDPRDISNPAERTRSMSRRYQVQQDALKEVVARSERTLAGVKDRVATISELANMIDKTENQKDAQDLTNRILVEVLATLTDMLQIAAQSNQAEALFNYRGATDATMAKRKQVLDDATAATDAFKQTVKGMGNNYP